MPSTASAPSVDIAGFVPIPNHLLLSPSLSPESKLTYQIIRYHDRGRGCFACREKMAQEVGLSLYHLRKGICELVDHGIVALEKRRMGLTDLIRLTDHDWGLPQTSPAEEPTEPPFEAPPEPELPEGPQPSDELLQAEEAPDRKPVEEVNQPVELPVQTSETPRSNELNYKNNTINNNNNNNNKHTPVEPGRIEQSDKVSMEQQCDELVLFFYETKEDRTPEKIELQNWRPVAWKLLSQYSLDELKLAAEHAIKSGARLFFYLSLAGPGYIAHLRREKAKESDRQKRASTALEAQRQQTHQLEALRASAREFEGQTRSLLARLEEGMRMQAYNVWFRDAFITNLTQDTLTLAVASPEAVEWITQRYTALLQEISGKADIHVIAAG